MNNTNERPRIFFFRQPRPGQPMPWARGYQWVARQPGWPMRVAAIAFMIVVGLPLLLLFMVALLVATAVFGVLLLVHKVRRFFEGDPARGGGRENVRVIARDPRE